MLKRKNIIFKSIINLIKEINEFVEYINSYDEFSTNKLIKKACKANLVDIGQALKDLQNNCDYILTYDDKKLVKLRNLVTHQYWKNSDLVMWNLINEYLPILKEKITKNNSKK